MPARAQGFHPPARRSVMNKMFVPAVIVVALLSGCGNSNPTSPNSTFGQFSVMLTDAPASVQSVLVNVASVLAHHRGAADDRRWGRLDLGSQAEAELSREQEVAV